MEKHDYNLTKIFKYINRRTIGLRFPGGRHDILNKFGVLFDLLNKEGNNWNQSMSVESGSQLINFFDFKRKDNKESLFISTSRIGFTYSELLKKDNDTKLDFKQKIENFNEIYEKLIQVFDYLKFDRFGVYFEIPLTLKDINEFTKLEIFRWFSGYNYTIDQFEEINTRFGIILNKKNEENFDKIILNLSKVLDPNDIKSEIKYLLTIDYQEYFPTVELRSSTELLKFLSEKFEDNYDKLFTYISNLCLLEENSK
ncbi:hypothetical protein EHR01_06555 [Leptospira mtsangambouensis]|uniref:TIGR04255 family protein n=1 Tax=Leptospira mtsangambouensis TaxID=2484912 RepID=A0ABY2P4S8_9LEPT|nr:hypothetical protein [Leptospira mtsangambouensis]TGM82436.1 hypothetical protein EHR01_06555 [Leptospira mtsangambouensis]